MKKLILLCFLIHLLQAQPNTIFNYGEGNKDDCNDRGVAYGEKGEFGKAFPLYKKACDLNSSRGCSNLGFMYMNGQGVKRDFVMAVQYLEKGFTLGDYHLAATNLGIIYARGYGEIKKDKIKAMLYFRQGCEKFSRISCANLAVLKDENDDSVKAFYYYERACILGDGKSCFRFGVGRYYGRGIKVNKEESLRAFFLGCKYGDTATCQALIFMIYRGEGGALPDMKLAKVYRKRACKLGAKDACGEDEEYYKRFD